MSDTWICTVLSYVTEVLVKLGDTFGSLEGSGSGKQHEVDAHRFIVKGAVTCWVLAPWQRQWIVSLRFNFKIKILLEDFADRFLRL